MIALRFAYVMIIDRACDRVKRTAQDNCSLPIIIRIRHGTIQIQHWLSAAAAFIFWHAYALVFPRASRHPIMSSEQRYTYTTLMRFASKLGERSGLSAARARVQAEVLLEADLMGHTTHGLNLLPGFLRDLEAKTVDASGVPEVLRDRGSVMTWDGHRAPGTWLVSQAIDAALARISLHPVFTVVIQRSGHVGALAPYLRRIVEHGFVAYLVTTNPLMRTVVPPGGLDPLIAPNPIGFGCPTNNGPILIDISTSTVANGWVRRWAKEGTPLADKWIQDASGTPTNDASALFGPPKGALLPLGGELLGHKGFALGLMVELLTGGLTGVGHAGAAADAGNLVYLQVMDPEAFAGRSAFEIDAGALAEACRASRSRVHGNRIRMPGDRALALRARQLASGVELYPSILPELAPWASRYGIAMPEPAPAA